MKVKHSIRKRLVISQLILSILPLLLLGWILSWQSFNFQQAQALKLQREASKRAARIILTTIHKLEDYIIIANKFASFMELDYNKQYNELSKLRSYKGRMQQDLIEEVTLLDNSGKEMVRVSNKFIYTPDDLGDLSRSEKFTQPFTTKKIWYSSVYFNDVTGNPMITMGMPFTDPFTGNVQGVLISKIRLKFIWNIIANIKIGETGTAYILDDINRIIAHKNPSVVLRGTHFNMPEHSGIVTGLEGEKAVLSFEKIYLGTQPLFIATELPVTEALRQTRYSLYTITVFLLLTLSGALALGFVIIRDIVRPVESLCNTALAIGKGDITKKAEVYGKDEIGVLGNTFNSMTSMLVQTIESLRIEKETLRKYLDISAVIVVIIDAEQKVTLINKKGCDILGYSENEITGKNWFDNFIPERLRKDVKSIYTKLMAGEIELVTYNENEVLTRNGKERYIAWHNTILADDRGNITAVLSSGVDITEHKKAERAIKESHERLLTVLDGLNAIVYAADLETYEVLFINKYTRDIFGDITGKLCWQTLQSSQTGPCEFCSNDKLVSAKGTPAGVYNWELKNTVNGRWYYIQDRAITWVDGRIVRLEIATDITDRKVSEEKMTASLREKELLLREIHHRVKNNMQVISSLLDFQSEYFQDRKYIQMFKESKDRIRSMALVHEKLYRSEDISRIDFKDYLTGLANGLFISYSVRAGKIDLRMDIQNILLNIDTAVPCGLIINELLSNSLKHAFPEDMNGQIHIIFKKTGTDGEFLYELIVSDNGVGIPGEIDFRKTNTLGLHLVSILAEHQLQGKLELDRTDGTMFRILFKEPKYKKRI